LRKNNATILERSDYAGRIGQKITDLAPSMKKMDRWMFMGPPAIFHAVSFIEKHPIANESQYYSESRENFLQDSPHA
jgi:hypothetical protein